MGYHYVSRYLCVGPEVLEEPMAYYRLYFMDAFNGRIDRFIQFEVDNDEAAINFAQEWQGSLTLDLCNGVRPVKHWGPLTLPQSPPIQPSQRRLQSI